MTVESFLSKSATWELHLRVNILSRGQIVEIITNSYILVAKCSKTIYNYRIHPQTAATCPINKLHHELGPFFWVKKEDTFEITIGNAGIYGT